MKALRAWGSIKGGGDEVREIATTNRMTIDDQTEPGGDEIDDGHYGARNVVPAVSHGTTIDGREEARSQGKRSKRSANLAIHSSSSGASK